MDLQIYIASPQILLSQIPKLGVGRVNVKVLRLINEVFIYIPLILLINQSL